MKRLVAAVAIAILPGCVSQEQMDAAPVARSVSVSENYQAVYARTNKGMRNCFEIGSYSSVDGQLYPDLGYGEVTASGGGFTASPLLYARISKAGPGARIDMKTSIWGATEGSHNWLAYWSKGGLKCPVVGFGEAPPAI